MNRLLIRVAPILARSADKVCWVRRLWFPYVLGCAPACLERGGDEA